MIFFLLIGCMGFIFDFDAGPLTWPQSTWVLSPISSTSWHSGQTVTLSVTFNPSTSLDDGIVELILPTGFSTTNIKLAITESIVAGEDYSMSFSNILLPAQGTYGPVGIRTRVASTGNIVNSNLAFCTLAIDKTIPVATANSLTATFYDISKVYVKDSSSIYFDFSISQDLWKFDIFYLYVDSHFTMGTPTCKSLKVIGEYNNINSTNPEALNTLSCYYDSAENRVVMYGLGVDIYVAQLSSTGKITARLLVTGFTNPNADYSDSTYLWNLYIGRYGLNTYIAAYKGSGPSTQTGEITVTSWVPYSGYSDSKIVLGMTTYMDLTMTFQHDIPSTGQIYIKFSGGVDNLNKSWRFLTDGSQSDVYGSDGYYFFTPSIGASCSVAATTITCSGFYDDIPAGTLVLTTFTYFISTSPSVSEIISYADSGVTKIDEVSANPASIIYASSTDVALATDFYFYFASDKVTTNYIAKTGPTAAYVVSHVQVPVTSSASTYKIYFPVSLTLSETTVKMGSSVVGEATEALIQTDDLSSGTSAVTSVSLTDNLLSYTASVTASNYYSALFYNDNGSSLASSINFPFVSSNKYTRYEVRLEVTISSILYVYSRALTFIPDDPTLTFTLMCIDSGTAGIPASISFTPNFSYSSSNSLYIAIAISGTMSTDFDSGLSSGEAYPFYSATGSTGSMYCNFLSGKKLIWTDFTSITSGTEISLTFPMGSLTDLANYYVSISLYYINTSMNTVQNVLISATSATVAAAVKVNNWHVQTITSSTSYTTSNAVSTLTMSLTPATGVATATSGYIGVFLPTGYSISSAAITGISNLAGVFSFTSSNMYYKTPGIFGELDGTNTLNSAGTSFTFTGAVTSTYFNPSSSSSSIKPIQARSSGNLACLSLTGTYPTISLSAALIETPLFTPDSAVGGGPDSLKLDISAAFVNTHKIPNGGQITFALASGWAITTISTLLITVNSIDITSALTVSLGTTGSLNGLPEIIAASSIKIFIYNAMPPSNAATDPVTKATFSSISTYATSETTEKIDSWTDSTANAIQFTTSEVQGNTTVIEVDTFPNSTSISAFFRVVFSAQHNLPTGGTITITSPIGTFLNSGDVSKTCYFSLNYTTCTVSGSLVITIAEDYIANTEATLLLDNSLLITSLGEQLSKLYITTAYGGFTIDKNTDTAETIWIGSTLKSLTSTLDFSPTTAGEIANYTLNLTGTFEKSSIVRVVFPNEFPALLGKAYEKYKITEPEVYYLDCFTDLGNIECLVKHRILTFVIPAEITTSATIIFLGIANPVYISTGYTSLKVYISNSTDYMIYANENVILAGVTAVPLPIITFRTISVTNYYLQQSADYTFQFVLTSSTVVGDQLVLEFPSMFEISRDFPTTLPCSLKYIDTVADLKTYVDVNGSSECTSLRNNQIFFNITEDMTWTSTLMAFLKVQKVVNPDLALEMSTELDSNVYDLYDEWTSQFSLKVLRSTGYIAGSSSNLNTAYSGLSPNTYSFVVNEYQAKGETGIISIVKGTQSAVLYIKTAAFQSKVAQVSPSNGNNMATLKYSSSTDFKIYNGGTYIAFQVSAPISSTTSLNYITWELTEVALDGSSQKYVKPIKTRVEVYSDTLVITTGTIFSIGIGETSLPVSVTLPNSPYDSLIIAISCANSYISITPEKLSFATGENIKYYEIQVSANYTGSVGDLLTITYSLSGTDSAAYRISSPTFKIGTGSSADAVIKSISFSGITATAFKATVVTDIATTLCWELSEQSTSFISYEELIASTASLVGENAMPTFDEQITSYLNGIDKTPSSGESWKSFQRRLYKDFIQQVWLGCVYTGKTTVALFNIDWLWADTTYKLVVFAGTTEGSATATTSYHGDALNVTIKIGQKVDKSYLDSIKSAFAGSIGVLNEQVAQSSTTLTDSASTIVEAIYGNRNSPVTPKSSYTSLDKTSFTDSLTTLGIIASPTFSSSSLVRSSYATSAVSYLSTYSVSLYTITVQANATVSGEICCIAEIAANLTGSVNSTQILLGLDRKNEPTAGSCKSYTAGADLISVSMNSLDSDTEYLISCEACNAYPVWPLCGTISTINVSTSDGSGGEGTVSLSGYLSISLLLIISYL